MTAPAAVSLPAELAIDTDIARRIIGGFIREQLRQAGFEKALLGLSGGVDSALTAALVAEAIGPERLLCVLMPYRTSSADSLSDAHSVVDWLGCANETVEITGMVDAYAGIDGRADVSPLRRGNLAARMRMALLYDKSVSWPGLVVGTGNKTELLIGYTTLWGDSASAFVPLGDLYKTQLRQLATVMGVPRAIIEKAPSADLWPGQTDEGEMGVTYPVLDRLLYWMVDRRRDPAALAVMGFPGELVARVARMVAGSEFKRQMPPIAKLGPRTVGVDYLYPRRRPGSARDA